MSVLLTINPGSFQQINKNSSKASISECFSSYYAIYKRAILILRGILYVHWAHTHFSQLAKVGDEWRSQPTDRCQMRPSQVCKPACTNVTNYIHCEHICTYQTLITQLFCSHMLTRHMCKQLILPSPRRIKG